MKYNKYLISLLVLTILGFILRIYSLSTQSIWMDESFSMNAAYETLEKGYPLLDSGAFYGLSYLLHTYLISFFMLIFNDVFGARLVSVIFGVLTIVLSYYFGKKFFNKELGILLALIITFSFWEIVWSRQARMYMQLQFFYLLSLLLFYEFTLTKKKLMFLSLSTLLSVFTHPFGFTLILIYVFYFILNYKTLKEFNFNFLKNKWFFFSFLIALIFSVYYLINYNYVNIVYFTQYHLYLRNIHFPYFYLGILGLILSLKEFRKGSLLLLSFLIPFLFVSYLVPLIHFRYLFFFLPILFLSSLYLIYYISSVINLNYRFWISLALILLIMFNYSVFIPRAFYSLEAETPQPDFKNAFNFVKENLEEDDIVITPYPTVARVYGVDVDYVLDYNPSGRTNGTIKSRKNPDIDWYTKKEVLKLNKFGDTISDKTGYILVDKFSLGRMGKSFSNLIVNSTEIKKNNRSLYSEIYIYEFP